MLVNHTVPQALSKPVYLHNIVCSSRKLSLFECSYTRYSGNINDIQDAIVTCQQRKHIAYNLVAIGTQLILGTSILAQKPYTASCSDGDLKLVGGMSETEGRLEVCLNKRWGTIHGHGWTHTETEAACNQLGYPTSGIDKIYSTSLLKRYITFLQILPSLKLKELDYHLNLYLST